MPQFGVNLFLQTHPCWLKMMLATMWVNNITTADFLFIQGPLDAPLPNTECRPGDPKCQVSCKCYRHQNLPLWLKPDIRSKFLFQDSCSTVEEEVCSQVSQFLVWSRSTSIVCIFLSNLWHLTSLLQTYEQECKTITDSKCETVYENKCETK